MSPAETRRRARRGEGELLRGEIITAAAELLTETGDEAAVSIRAVADRVGVTPPSIYRHFADKDDLLFAVCSGVFDTLTDRLRTAIDVAGGDRLARLRAALATFVTFGLDHPEHYRLIFMRPPVLPAGVTLAEFRAACEAGLPGTGAGTAGGDAVAAQGWSGPELTGAAALVLVYELIGDWLGSLDEHAGPLPDQFAMATSLWAHAHGITALRIAKPDFSWPPLDDQFDVVIWPLAKLSERRR